MSQVASAPCRGCVRGMIYRVTTGYGEWELTVIMEKKMMRPKTTMGKRLCKQEIV